MTKVTIVAALLSILFSIGLARADAILEGFDSPNRAPNSYIIIFDDLPDLGFMDPNEAVARGEPRSSVHAHNKARVEELARKIALQYHGRVTAVYWVAVLGFAGVFSKTDILELSKDAHIKSIAANEILHVY
jgi:hypothetical protein